MRAFLAIIIFMFVCTTISAQTPGQPGNNQAVRICTPSRSSVLTPPLYILFEGKKEIYRTNVGIPNIQPQDIASIEVLKGISATTKYGSRANYGVVEIYMKKDAKLDTNKIKPDTTRLNLHTDPGKVIRYRGGK